MAAIHAVGERLISAPPSVVYEVLANFRDHHPHILPTAFSNFRVEEGGHGAGTVSSFTVTINGRPRAYRTMISEPDPGRVMVETDTLSDTVTTFTIEPAGDDSRVRLDSVWSSAGGFTGWLERRFAPGLISKLYADELARLDAYARELASERPPRSEPRE